MRLDVVILAARSDGSVLVEDGSLPVLRLDALEAEQDDELVMELARPALAARIGSNWPILELHLPSGFERLDLALALLVIDGNAGESGPPSGTRWGTAAEVDEAVIADVIRPRAAEWLAEVAGRTAVPSLRSAWSRPGWLARVTEWLDGALAQAGRRRTGPVEQLRLWGISSLLRAETDRGKVWVKAAYPPFAAEPRTTRFLAVAFPELVPRVVATDEQEGWTVLEDFGSSFVGEGRESPAGIAAVYALAQMQQMLVPRAGELLAAGAIARPLRGLAERLADAFTESIEPKPFEASERHRADLVEVVAREAAALANLGIPDTLLHGDFHPWNVADIGGRPLIFDWTDTAVGHPLLDFATWVGWVKDPEQRRALWDPWVEAWSTLVPVDELRARYRQVLGLGAAYQVVSYVGIVRTLEPSSAPQVSGGATSFARLVEEALGEPAGAVIR